jgi:mRNA interferase MazF
LNENTDQGDVILAFISSLVPSQASPASVFLETKDTSFHKTGLKTGSVIRLDKIATIERSLITRRIGHLPKSKLQAVDKALVAALQISLKRS